MAQYINKEDVEKILKNLWKQDDGTNPEHRICYNKALQEIQCKLDSLEIKKTDGELQGLEKEVAEGYVGLVNKKRVPIELKGELKAKFKNEFNTLWQIVNRIDFANVAKPIVERMCLNFATWGFYNLSKIGDIKGNKEIDSIEMKEVDLKKEINNWIEDNTCRGYCSASINETAEYFFELGLKTKKGE